MKIQDVDRDQCLQIPKTNTLVATNVRKLSEVRRWSAPTSFFCEFTDIGSGQCLQTSKIETLIAANVWEISKKRHWS